jgi:hypothetical protein
LEANLFKFRRAQVGGKTDVVEGGVEARNLGCRHASCNIILPLDCVVGRVGGWLPPCGPLVSLFVCLILPLGERDLWYTKVVNLVWYGMVQDGWLRRRRRLEGLEFLLDQ